MASGGEMLHRDPDFRNQILRRVCTDAGGGIQ
jgi:hypothetical protein